MNLDRKKVLDDEQASLVIGGTALNVQQLYEMALPYATDGDFLSGKESHKLKGFAFVNSNADLNKNQQ